MELRSLAQSATLPFCSRRTEAALQDDEKAVTCAAGLWSVESIREPNGERAIVIMPQSGDDADGATLAIWPLEASYRLDELRWDVYRTVGYYSSIAEVVEEAGRRILGGAVQIRWPVAKAAAGKRDLVPAACSV